MIFNKITLAFPEKEEILFREKYFSDAIIQFRIAFLLIIILYGLFGYLDALMVPDHTHFFFMIRYVFVIPLLSTVLLLSFTKIFRKIWQELLFISFIVGGTGISIMTMIEPENYTYYGGLMLIFTAGYFFIKLRFLLATIAGWTTLLIFNIGIIYFTNVSNLMLISHNFFFISANLIGMFAAYYIEYKTRRNFFLNQKLDHEKLLVEETNKNLEEKVEKRTEELKKAKEKAEESNRKLKQSDRVFNLSLDMFCIAGFDGYFKYLNPAWERTLGWSTEELLSKPWLDFVHPDDAEKTENIKSVIVDGKEVYKFENRYICIDGSTKWLSWNSQPFPEENIMIGAVRDITEAKRIENELIKAKEKAEEGDRLKTAFLANMSHEIRTPMNGIIGFTDILSEADLSGEEKDKYIKVIQKSGDRLLSTVNNIIDISKIESGQMEVSFSEFNIGELTEQLYAFFEVEARKKGLELILNTPAQSHNIILDSDSEKINSVLTNLIKNAIKYTPSGKVEFGYQKIKNEFQFFVKDSGIGISKEGVKVIFDRFRRVSNEEGFFSEGGSGLGLAITKAYVDMLGGKIWVESEKGEGTQFYFTIPYGVVKDHEHSSKEADSVTEGKTKLEVSGLKILIAEDDESSIEFLKVILKDISSELIHVLNGKEAVEQIKNHSDIDLVLMDINMPGMNGYDATKEIRKFNKEVLIIAQTAYALTGDQEKAIEAGCDDYISKPIKKEKLLEKIEKCLVKK